MVGKGGERKGGSMKGVDEGKGGRGRGLPSSERPPISKFATTPLLTDEKEH